MKRITALLTTATCLVCLCFTNTTSAQSLLWEISGNGLEKPSYIYGTIHMTCPEDIVVSDVLKEAFDKTDQLVLEIDMDAPDFMQKSQMLSVSPGMKNFSDDLSEKDKKLLNDYLQKHFKVGLAQIGIMKPFVIQSMILSKAIDCPQPASYEQTFMKITEQQNEEILGLEEVEDQFGIFDKIPQDKQLEWLVEYVSDENEMKEKMREIIEAHKSQDLAKIHNITIKDPEFREYSNLLLTDRNKKWITKIESYSKANPTIYAVGAAHLPGKEGVLELLRKRGYTVTSVK